MENHRVSISIRWETDGEPENVEGMILHAFAMRAGLGSQADAQAGDLWFGLARTLALTGVSEALRWLDSPHRHSAPKPTITCPQADHAAGGG